MSLALPKDIAARSDLVEVLFEMLGSMAGPVIWHVCEGRLTGQPINKTEAQEAATAVADCRFVYVLEGMRGRFEPIAAFVASEALGRAQLFHLIDDYPVAPPGKLPRRTTEYLGVYIQSLIVGNPWLNVVTVPASLKALDGCFGLQVLDGEVSSVTLRDAGHRPESSRKEWR
jgi:hypothetical protein